MMQFHDAAARRVVKLDLTTRPGHHMRNDWTIDVKMRQEIADDAASINRLETVKVALKVLRRATGLRIAVVARVTDHSWTACAVLDEAGFGLLAGDQLDVSTTFCSVVQDTAPPLLINHASADPRFTHHLRANRGPCKTPSGKPSARVGGGYLDPFTQACPVNQHSVGAALRLEILEELYDAHHRLAFGLACRMPADGLEAEVYDTECDVAATATASVDRECVLYALASLPPPQRTAVELAYFSGFSHTEIAGLLNLPVGTVKGRIRLGLDRLRRAM